MISHPVLNHLGRFGIHLGLERMSGFLGALGDPHRAFPSIHVAGTNGKFSVVQMLTSVLGVEGYKVGVYTSPHLQRVNERIRIGDEEISDAALGALLDELDVARRTYAAENLAGVPGDELLTYFEILTAAAFLHFARQAVDVAVVEVGLGGRLDATNVVESVVSGIVSVGLDHMDRLGPDHASIAAEKAGILKPGVPAVVGPLPLPAMRTVRAIAADRGSPLYVPDAEYRLKGRKASFQWACGSAGLRELSINVDGAHQLENAGVALTMLHLLPAQLAVSEQSMRAGLAATRIPGRLEWLAPDLLVDSAHNAEGAARLAEFLRERSPDDRPVHLLLGMSNDKDARSVAAALGSVVDRVYTTQCGHPRACSAGDLATRLVSLDVPVLPAGPIEDALPVARAGGALVVVAGSVFLAGAVRDLVGAP